MTVYVPAGSLPRTAAFWIPIPGGQSNALAMTTTLLPEMDEESEHQLGSPAAGVRIAVIESFVVGASGEKESVP